MNLIESHYNSNWTYLNKPTEKETPYILASIKERLLFDTFWQSRQDFTINAFSYVESKASWDIYYTSGGTKYLAEIKIRNYNSNQFFTEGWALEETKYLKLIDYIKTPKAKEKGVKAVYVNVFFDGVMIWNVNELKNYKFQWKKFPKSSVCDKGFIMKNVTLLLKNSGTFYRLPVNLSEASRNAKTVFHYLYPSTLI